MDITVDEHGNGSAVVKLAGRLDMIAAAETKQRIVDVVGSGRRQVVVDLQDVSFIDSSGLGALIGGLKAARQAGGELRIARPSEQALVVLELTTLNRVLKPYTSLEEALAGYT